MRTELLYIAIPHWNVSVRASVVGTSIFTGVLSGSSFSSLSSGNTTSLAQVPSVVRTKTSEAGLPFSTVTLLGVKPLPSTMTFVCWTPGGAGGIGGSGSAFDSDREHDNAMSAAATKPVLLPRFGMRMGDLDDRELLPRIAREATAAIAVLWADSSCHFRTS